MCKTSDTEWISKKKPPKKPWKSHKITPISPKENRDEGTSYHYIAPSPEIEADTHSIQILENVLTDCGYSYVKGKTWTSDAIYRETLSAIEERRQEGCIAVEMECASMLAVSKYRHIPFIQFLYGADNLSSDTWEIRDLISYGLTNAEKYMMLPLNVDLLYKKAGIMIPAQNPVFLK